VLLKNVKMKIMADGAKLEGDMWPDDKNPDKVQIEKSQRVRLPTTWQPDRGSGSSTLFSKSLSVFI
jgi:hypothetical protein